MTILYQDPSRGVSERPDNDTKRTTQLTPSSNSRKVLKIFCFNFPTRGDKRTPKGGPAVHPGVCTLVSRSTLTTPQTRMCVYFRHPTTRYQRLGGTAPVTVVLQSLPSGLTKNAICDLPQSMELSG